MKWKWALGAGVLGAVFVFGGKKASAADVNALLEGEEGYGPLPPEGTSDNAEAEAQALAAYLRSGGNFGTKNNPSKRVAEAQRVLQVADDGIVGPNTRAAALQLGVRVPFRPGMSPTPVSTKTVTPEAQEAGAMEPESDKTPREQKGSLVVRVVLTNLPMLATVGMVESKVKQNVAAIGSGLALCPGAPRLVGSPSVSVREQGGAYLVDMRWAGLWSNTGVNPALKSCIAQKAQNNSELKSYYTASVITRS